MNLYEYRGQLYPGYLKDGNACRFVDAYAQQFCQGYGVDVGAGNWPLPFAVPVEIKDGGDAMNLPGGPFDYVFSSHCLEHLPNPVAAIEHWQSKLKIGGVLFLNLPHPEMTYWRPENCRKHLHMFWPRDVVSMLETLGFKNIINSERDLSWSFQVVGYK